jgi:sec-independent protein translocase protein TatC
MSSAPDSIQVMTDINKYLDFVLKLFFAFGFAFEIPVATFLVITTGLVSKDRIKNMRPYLIISFVIIGMFLTPPDIFSQLFLALPMWLLFEIGLLVSKDEKN